MSVRAHGVLVAPTYLCFLLIVLFSTAQARLAHAQVPAAQPPPEPAQAPPVSPPPGPAFVGPFVVDVRGVMASFPDDTGVAAPRGLQTGNLPARGFGGEAGVHFYPLRRRVVTLGVGASVLWSRGQDSPDPDNPDDTGPGVTTTMTALAPQVSLNFGSSRGWSYVSGGFGTLSLAISRADEVDEESARTTAFNFGGGARWFFADHVAFGFDLRFHAYGAQEPSGTSAGFPANTKFVAATGLSFK